MWGKEPHIRTQQKQALVLTLLSQAAFAKLKTLASPTPVSEPSLDQIMEHLILHYKPQSIKIVKTFKFFKGYQFGGESTTEFITELHRLVKTYNWQISAIRDQGSICMWIKRH